MRINGVAVSGYEGRTLLEYLEENKYRTALIAIEYNGRILDRAEFAETVLGPEDEVEIVSFMGGG